SGLVFDLCLVSTARRARETFNMILRELPRQPAWEFEASLYNAGVDTLRELLAQAPGWVKTLAIVGHNPGLGEFARAAALLGARMDLTRRGSYSSKQARHSMAFTLMIRGEGRMNAGFRRRVRRRRAERLYAGFLVVTDDA
ncbi:MAG: SixA phosphatase family protein, partial [Beijerinckiaceae bacterium]